MAQGYTITNTQNNMQYHGIVYKKNKTYMDRFAEHMCGKGGVILFKQGVQKFGPQSFTCNLIIESDDINVIREWENAASRASLWPAGYNGNAGNVIINTKSSTQRAKNTRIKKFGSYSNGALKGKTWNDIHGEKKSTELKNKKRQKQTGISMKDRLQRPEWVHPRTNTNLTAEHKQSIKQSCLEKLGKKVTLKNIKTGYIETNYIAVWHEKYNLTKQCISALSNNKQQTHKGWELYKQYD